MRWKTMGQIILLLIIGAIIFYFIYPKWYFYPRSPIKANKITGQIYKWSKGRWVLVTSKFKHNLIDDLGTLDK